MTALTAWQNFYVIVGSSAGALIGLQFVVITLIADLPAVGSPEATSAFGTPTVIHFCAVLLLAALLCIPWSGIGAAAVAWGLTAVCGVVYQIVVFRRMRGQGVYQPVLEDWFFYLLLPFVAYGALAVAACTAPSHTQGSLFAVGAVALLLLFIGIHNAWDAVTYHIFVVRKRVKEKVERAKEKAEGGN